MGFPSVVSQCPGSGICGTRQRSNAITRIIPDMNFTCTGTVTRWRAAGLFETAGRRRTDAMLGIWREISANPGTYERISEIPLGTCGQLLAPSIGDIYECVLRDHNIMRVTVQPGDVIGIEIAANRDYRFRLYFTDNRGPTNYQFDGKVSTATLSQVSLTVQDQPQISLTVEPLIVTTALSVNSEASTADVTTTQPPTIEISTTDFPMATQFPTTVEASTTDITTTKDATTQPPTFTRVPTTTEAVTTYDTASIFESTTEDTETNDQMTGQATSTTDTLDTFVSESHTEILDANSNNVEAGNSNGDLGLLVGSALAGVVGITLLSAVAILILIVVYQSRKYKKTTRDREIRTVVPQNINALDGIEMKANLSYISVFHQISTGDNVAYGEMVNQDSNELYEIIDPPIEDSTTQLTSHTEQSEVQEDNTEYDYANN